MTFPILWIIFLVLFAVLPFGCVGKDRALLMTKTNVGLDIDTTPPTAEITIARRELAIQPTFPNNIGKDTALPLLATFGKTGNYFNPSITGHFAGGTAAAALATPLTEDLTDKDKLKKLYDDSEICLRSNSFNSDNSPEEKEPRPFYFATDTSYGLKVAWSGLTSTYPDSLKLGYNRKEFASPPIFVDDTLGSCDAKDADGEPVEDEDGKKIPGYKVEMPSFFVAIDNASGFSTFYDSGVEQVQVFATGEAAMRLAKDKYIREIAYNLMAPKAAKLKANQLGLNQDLINEIEEAFNKANNEKKLEIMAAAKILKLVDVDEDDELTRSSKFVEELKKHSDSMDPKVSTNLIIVRRVAVTPPEKPADPAAPTQ